MTDDRPSAFIAAPPILQTGAPARVLAALPGARAVGGLPRDSLAGLPVHDVDVAAPYPPEELAARLTAADLRVHPTGLAHGTVTAVLDKQSVEVTSLRRDVATDGRHAEVAWTQDWREDAARRDFTINAMSLSADGALWDYFGGEADLAAGRVRFVGDPSTRLREDYLRALRFFRFFARYGHGGPDADALAAIRAAVPGLVRLSPERVWMELKRLLVAPDPTGALDLMEQAGVLAAVLPEAADPSRLRRVLSSGLPLDAVLRLAVAIPLGAEVASLPTRLRWSADEAERFAVLRQVAEAPTPESAKQGFHLRAWRAQVRSRSRLVAPIEPTWILQAELGGEAEDWAELRERLSPGADPEFPLRGKDALDLGVPSGPRVGELLAEVRAYWVGRDCNASRDLLLARLRELASADAG